jgi:peptide/nickel transport system permease protein
MLIYITRRLAYIIPMLLLISIMSFFIVQLTPGGFLVQYEHNPRISPDTLHLLEQQLGLDQPLWGQYLGWLKGMILHGNFGYSFVYHLPVAKLVGQQLFWTFFITFVSALFTWAIAIPLGVYAATHQNSPADYVMNFLAFLAHAIPDFLVALLLIYLLLALGAPSVGGILSAKYIGAPLSWGLIGNLLQHLWPAILAIGLGGIGSILRLMRGNVLDVLSLLYIQTARAKGVSERRIVWKHAVRNAVNPLISIAGLSLPYFFSGSLIVSIILNLPTMGPFFYQAILNKDLYVVMDMLVFYAALLQLGNLMADIALARLDPRIVYT